MAAPVCRHRASRQTRRGGDQDRHRRRPRHAPDDRQPAFTRLAETWANGARILAQPCPGLVEQIEQGELDDPENARSDCVVCPPARRTGRRHAGARLHALPLRGTADRVDRRPGRHDHQSRVSRRPANCDAGWPNQRCSPAKDLGNDALPEPADHRNTCAPCSSLWASKTGRSRRYNSPIRSRSLPLSRSFSMTPDHRLLSSTLGFVAVFALVAGAGSASSRNAGRRRS